MALKYSYRHLFFKGILRPRRLYALLEDMDERIKALENGSDESES